ncbi:MAG: ribbon-helix-helix domain-containing protein [Gammaproteobacteria bacterium]
MGKTIRKRDTLYLDPEKFELLQHLAKDTRIPRAELLREAVDDLLTKHGATRKSKVRKLK